MVRGLRKNIASDELLEEACVIRKQSEEEAKDVLMVDLTSSFSYDGQTWAEAFRHYTMGYHGLNSSGARPADAGGDADDAAYDDSASI